MNDICNFIPSKIYESSINYYHFVYETNLRKFSQPFVRSNFYMCLVFRGSAVLKTDRSESHIKKGTLFFTFPEQIHYIEASKDFSYLYISFNGKGALPLLDNFNINPQNSVFENYDHLLEFWMSAIRRITAVNASTLTESTLMYTLSFINTQRTDTHTKDKFDAILDYISHNYTLKDISLKKIADIFFYNEKYLSALFTKKTGVKFTYYINNLRINYAINLIENGEQNISDLAGKCGYTDQFYFSKIFKKTVNKTPTEYIKMYKQPSN